MKNDALITLLRISILIALLTVPSASFLAQDFQRSYGTAFNNSFAKVIKDGTNYYVLGQEELSAGADRRGTVTRLDANGMHQWTLIPSIACIWNDAVLTPSGLLVVGSTLPFDANSKSLIGLVDPAGGGNFTWLRSYDEPGRDGFTRIVKNPVPENASFPYYILGTQNQPGGGVLTDDVVLLNMDVNGTFHWKKIFLSTADDEYSRDLEALSNGHLLLAGNATVDVIFEANNSGIMVNGAQTNVSQLTFRDIAQASGGNVYAAATTGSGESHVMKFDANLFLLWDARIQQLSFVDQVWEGPSGDIYVTGRGVFGGISRGVIMRLNDTGPSVVWVKYLNQGSSFSGESSWLMPNGQIAFTDARIWTNGFGQNDAFISLSDENINTCSVTEDIADLELLTQVPNSPVLPVTEFMDIPTGTDLTIFQELNWQQNTVCGDTCHASFVIIPLGACGHYQLTSTSTGTAPFTYQWCDGSIDADIDVTLPCGDHTFCLTITDANQCTSSASQTITVTDNTPPVAICAPPFGIILDSLCSYTIDLAQIDGGSTDNCQIQSLSVNPTTISGCGLFPVTLTVTDWCGNTSTCTTTIQAIEYIPPKITCPSDITVQTNPGQCYYTGPIPMPTATDNCNPNPVVNCFLVTSSGALIPITPQTQYPKGDNTICCIADDGCVEVSHLVCNYPCESKSGIEGATYLDKPTDIHNGNAVDPASVISIQPGVSPEVLVKDVLIGGNCLDVSNVTAFGQASQFGTFSNGLTNIGFSSGVILATGSCSVAIGPNNTNSASGGFGIITPDADLSTTVGGALFDKASLEFDFIPAQSTVTFNFVFASEEYCEYAGTLYTDAFGFFISGPGIIGGTQNIALIPLTTTPVNINTVNHFINSGFYINNTPSSIGFLCGQTPSTSPAVNEVQYDGFTTKFVATANVISGQTYHLKLAIADVGDGIFDSAVFLKAGSFDAGGNVSTTWEVNSNPISDIAYEDCGTVNLVFDRVGGNIFVPVTAAFTISGSATPGLDYVPFTSPVTIPAGQHQFILPVKILSDAVLEGDETIVVTLNDVCSVQNPNSILTIKDYSLFDAKCTFTVTVQDKEAPTIMCPPDLTVSGVFNPQGLCIANVGNLTPVSSDNCPMLMVDYSITGATTNAGPEDASGTTFSEGTSTVTYTGTDMGGNTNTCSFNVTVTCEDSCGCGTFSEMVIRFERGPGQPLTCGAAPVTLGCPPSGYSYDITGKFECQGANCPSQSLFDWDLQGPNGGTVESGSDFANPFFGIPISNLSLQQFGVYTLILTGHCGGNSCPCIIKFLVDPPCTNICPCTTQDIQDFSIAVNKGFAQILSNKTCSACFSPIDLDDCENVEWYLDNTTGTPIGTSKGSNTFCYTFPGSGTYAVFMVATRIKDDGTNCEQFTKSQTITLTCLNSPECLSSVFDNPTFSEGAIAGGLNSGGNSNGYKASSGNPKLNEGQFESLDGWTMQISGNIDTADVLTRLDPVCLEKGIGTVNIRIAVGDSGVQFSDRLFIKLFIGDNFNPNECDGNDCYELACVMLSNLRKGTWYDIEIPYDLSDWTTANGCGDVNGVLVRPAIYETNSFSTDQGGEGTESYSQVDNICFNGRIVSVEESSEKNSIRIFPNPTSGELIIQFGETIPGHGAVQIIDLLGRPLLKENLIPGQQIHTMSIASMPSGVYFVKVLEKGQPIRIEKVIKE